MTLSIPWDDCDITGICFDMIVRSLIKIKEYWWIFLTVHSLKNYCDDYVFLGDDSEMNAGWQWDDSDMTGKWLTDYCEKTG